MSKEKTLEEVQKEFIDQIKVYIDYWNRQDRDCKEKLEGLTHSILVILDGGTLLPGFQVIPTPHPDDKQYNINNEEDYYPDNVDIAGNLHELLYKKEI